MQRYYSKMNKDITDAIGEYGFGAVVEVASGMPFEHFEDDYVKKRNQAERGKKDLRRDMKYGVEIATGFAFYTSYMHKKARRSTLDFILQLMMFEHDRTEEAYYNVAHKYRLNVAEALVAKLLYSNRDAVNLVAIQERSARERELAREVIGLPRFYFKEPLKAVRGFVTEEYVALLMEEAIGLERCKAIRRIRYAMEDDSVPEGYKMFDTDVIVACSKDDFLRGLKRIKNKEVGNGLRISYKGECAE